jgi:hypothetical protein
MDAESKDVAYVRKFFEDQTKNTRGRRPSTRTHAVKMGKQITSEGDLFKKVPPPTHLNKSELTKMIKQRPFFEEEPEPDKNVPQTGNQPPPPIEAEPEPELEPELEPDRPVIQKRVEPEPKPTAVRRKNPPPTLPRIINEDNFRKRVEKEESRDLQKEKLSQLEIRKNHAEQECNDTCKEVADLELQISNLQMMARLKSKKRKTKKRKTKKKKHTSKKRKSKKYTKKRK